MAEDDAWRSPRLSRESRAFLEERVAAFEFSWSRGERPSIAEHLDKVDPSNGQLLVELVHADLEFRIKAGEPAGVEEYLSRFPELRHRPTDIDGLHAAELELRREQAFRLSQTVKPQRATPSSPTPIDQAAASEARNVSHQESTPRRNGKAAPSIDVGAALRDRKSIGRFEVERVLGQGGYGVVYLAIDPALGRQVALKVPHPHVLSDRTLRDRFLQEARAAASLEHPNVVPVLEAGEDGSLCFLITAYCPGENLAEWLGNQLTPVAPQSVAMIVAALADAVHYSHGRGVLHRDLKPANVMLDPRGSGTGEAPNGTALPFVPRLTDFGLAKIVEAGLAQTRTSVILGTPVYMSPEQADVSQKSAHQATSTRSG